MEAKIRQIRRSLNKWKPTHRLVRRKGRHLSELVISFWVNLTSLLHLIQFEKNSDGVYRCFRQWWRRVLHKISILVTVLLTCFHSYTAVSEVQKNGLTIRSLFVVTYAVAYATVSLALISMSLWAHELADWWNAATSILEHLTEEARTIVSPLNTYKTMLQIVPIFFFAWAAVPILTLQSLIFTNVPSHLATALESRIVLPKLGILGVTISWRIILLPAEFVHSGVPGAALILAATIIAYGLATNATVVSFLQEAPITSSVQRLKIHGLYMSLQLYNQLLGRALFSLLPCGIFLMMTSCTFTLYVTIVATNLPLALRAPFPVAGAMGFMITVIVSENAILVGKASEGVIDNVRVYDVRCVLRRGNDFARLQLRQATLYRRIGIQNGLFGFLEPNLPAMVAEETINQLLLLLSF